MCTLSKFCTYKTNCEKCTKKHLAESHNYCADCPLGMMNSEHKNRNLICEIHDFKAKKLVILGKLDNLKNDSFRKLETTCDLCPDLFPYSGKNLFMHKITKHPQKCQYCDYKTSTSVALRKHVSRKHRKEHKKIRDLRLSPEFKCGIDLCRYVGPSNGALYQHVIRMHIGMTKKYGLNPLYFTKC